MTEARAALTLQDKYTRLEGRVYMSAIQALVRLPLDQARRDRAAGLRTAGFVSGYRGSPLGSYDAALWNAQSLLDAHDIRFLPGLNEELAATSVRGTQQLEWFGSARVEGVFGLWYGKGLGTDRGIEALKLGNLEGAAPRGGVLVVTGDDHGGKSSASAHQSEHSLIAAMIPILYPSSPDEILEFGLAGWAMSRCTGLYVGLKCVTDSLDFSSTVLLPEARHPWLNPPAVAVAGGLGLQQLRPPLAQEDLTLNHRLPAAQAFARLNALDRLVHDAPCRNLSIVAAGKAFRDVRQALLDLGLDGERCSELGIRLYKPGLIWPLEDTGIIGFARGSRELLVVEEKRPVMEDQIATLLYAMPADQRPRLTGKRDHQGNRLLSSVGETSPSHVRQAIYRQLVALGVADGAVETRFRHFDRLAQRADRIVASPHSRPAFFCSGCPHNTSTKLPDGSIAMSAVGCHGLAAYTPERRTLMPTPMGGDGMPWVSIGPLMDRPHVFQNMGDGTYAHSGILSIRAAVAARSSMTFKILYNDAVAMTGGQPVEGAPTPVAIARQLLAEGVSPVVIISDDVGAFRGANRPPAGVEVLHRDRLEEAQRRLREIDGVSAIVYVQTCAAEKRRRRKRRTYPDPDRRVFINPDVCEGCGDCSVQSNCVSIQPLATELGRKRVIDQSSCNKDFSCVKGFCPAFVTVEGATVAKRASTGIPDLAERLRELPRPSPAGEGSVYSVLVTGIGGTGVLTIGGILGMAAHVDGKGCTVLDQTGMAQKGGAVTSHLRVGLAQDLIHTARLDLGMADLILACDIVVASSADVLRTIKPGLTNAILNTDVTTTGRFQTDRDLDLESLPIQAVIREALDGGAVAAFDATQLATRLTGDSIATNMLMLGYALQKGLLPVTLEALEEAIRLHGSNVAGNLDTMGIGRLAAHAPELFERRQDEPGRKPSQRPASLQAMLQSRLTLLTAYQNRAYAMRLRNFVDDIRSTLTRRGIGDGEPLLRELTFALARLMAYKDEYEVARLHTEASFHEALRDQFSGDFRLSFHLAPPLVSRVDPLTGRPPKHRFGGWMLVAFTLLRHLKALRGTPFDPFGYTRDRRDERALIEEFETLARDVAAHVSERNLDLAIELLRSVNEVRGYGPVKSAAAAAWRARVPQLMARFRTFDNEIVRAA